MTDSGGSEDPPYIWRVTTYVGPVFRPGFFGRSKDRPYVPLVDAPEEELERTYSRLGGPAVVYGHIHRSFVRQLRTRTIANSGSVSLSYDGDPRASYAVVEDGKIAIRRVSYDMEEEVGRLMQIRYPQADWIAQTLRTGAYVSPPDA